MKFKINQTFSFCIIFLILINICYGFYQHNDIDNVIELTESNHKNVLGNGLWFVEMYAKWCHHCQTLVPEWVKLAQKTKNVIGVASIDMEKGGKNVFTNVPGYPNIALFLDGVQLGIFEGVRNSESILKWGLDLYYKHITSQQNINYGNQKQNENAPSNKGLYKHDETDNVIRLYGETFNETIKEGIWLVEFYAPWCGHCQHLKGEWTKLAKITKGIYYVGALNMVDDNNGVVQGIGAYPTIHLYNQGEMIAKYDGPRTAERMMEFAVVEIENHILDSLSNPESINLSSKHGNKSNVAFEQPSNANINSNNKAELPLVMLNDANFESTISNTNEFWVVVFSLSICSPCVNQIHLIADALASMQSTIKVKGGYVVANENMVLNAKYSSNAYPHLHLFYNGELKSDLKIFSSKEEAKTAIMNLTETFKVTVEAIELSEEKHFNNIRTKTGATVLVFLPISENIKDSNEVSESGFTYIDEYEELTAFERKGLPIQYYWVKAHKFPKLQTQLSLYNFPIVVVINYEKKSYGVMKENFSSDNAIKFINEIVDGKHTLKKFSTLDFE